MDQDTAQRVDELIEEWLEGGGKQVVHYRCTKCGHDGQKTVDQSVDIDKLVRLRKELRDAAAKGGSVDVQRAADAILAQMRDMTDDELAAEIARVREA